MAPVPGATLILLRKRPTFGRGRAPDIGLKDIICGILPFVGLMMLGILILYLFPQIATAIPDAVYNK